MGALVCLVFEDNKRIKLAADAGAIPTLVAMLGTQSSAVIQEQVVRALGHLAFSDDCKVSIGAAGTFPPLVALLGPQNSEEVQKAAVNTLWALAWTFRPILPRSLLLASFPPWWRCWDPTTPLS